MQAIADTHTLLWYLLNDPRLSSVARSMFANAANVGEQIGIPAICIVEVVYLTEKNRIPLSALSTLQQHLQSGQTVLRILPLSEETAYQVQKIDRNSVPDMPDRIIAATALQYNLPLISRDYKIKTSGLATIW